MIHYCSNDYMCMRMCTRVPVPPSGMCASVEFVCVCVRVCVCVCDVSMKPWTDTVCFLQAESIQLQPLLNPLHGNVFSTLLCLQRVFSAFMEGSLAVNPQLGGG